MLAAITSSHGITHQKKKKYTKVEALCAHRPEHSCVSVHLPFACLFNSFRSISSATVVAIAMSLLLLFRAAHKFSALQLM